MGYLPGGELEVAAVVSTGAPVTADEAVSPLTNPVREYVKRLKQVPCGNDRQKGNGKSKDRSRFSRGSDSRKS
jgi:hypothetical protein